MSFVQAVKRYSAFIGIVAINVIAALYNVVTSLAFEHSTMHPTVYAFIRASSAAVILFVIAYLKERRRPEKDRNFWPAKEDLGVLIAVGTLCCWGNIGFGVLSLSQVPPALVGMMAPLAPVLAMCISLAIGMEPFNVREWTSWLKIIGLAVTVAGSLIIAIIASTGHSDLKAEAKNLPLGIALIFAAKTCAAMYPVVQKTILHKYRSPVVAAWMYVFGSMALGTSVAPLSVEPEFWKITRNGGLALLYAIVLASALNYTMISYVNKRLSPVILTASYPLESILAPTFAYLILGQKITVYDGIGGAIIISGLIIMVYAKLKEGLPGAAPSAAVAATPEHVRKRSAVFVDLQADGVDPDDVPVTHFAMPVSGNKPTRTLPAFFTRQPGEMKTSLLDSVERARYQRSHSADFLVDQGSAAAARNGYAAISSRHGVSGTADLSQLNANGDAHAAADRLQRAREVSANSSSNDVRALLAEAANGSEEHHQT